VVVKHHIHYLVFQLQSESELVRFVARSSVYTNFNSLLDRNAVCYNAVCFIQYNWQLLCGGIVLNNGRLLHSFQSTITDGQWRTVQLVNELLIIRYGNSVVQFSGGTLASINTILILCYCRL